MEKTRVYRLTVAYDGTDFHGFQYQPGQRTVQGELERALSQLAQRTVSVVAAGRTDQGVHAIGQVVSFEARLPVPIEKLAQVLNPLLPADLAIREARVAPPGFHARRSARWKEYEYAFFHDALRDPLRERYAWRLSAPLDGEAMRGVLPHLRACPDFRPFCQVGPEVQPARNLLGVALTETEAGWRFRIRAQSFLYKMVRRIVGLLTEVGRGRISLAEVPDYLQGRRSPMPLVVAPPHGLCLMRVGYEGE